MNEINRDMFEHKFTSEMHFRSNFEKLKCFRVMDEEGNIAAENKKYEEAIDKETLKKLYTYMVTIN